MPTINLKINRDIYNKAYLPLFDIHDRFSIRMGGAGSGKSVFTAQQIITRLCMETPHNVLIIRKFKNSHKFSTFVEITKVLSDWGLLKYCWLNKTDLTITLPNKNKIIFLGLDDAEKLKSISGITLVWIEEATEISKEEFEEVDRRLRGTPTNYFQIILTYNPISTNNWTYKALYLPAIDEKQDYSLLQTTYKDNRFLDEQYIRRLEEAQGNAYQVYTIGQYGVPEYLIYSKWNIVDEFPENVEDAIYGLDFGYEHPQVLARVYLKEEKLYVDEIIYETKQTIPMLIDKMKELLPKHAVIYGDSEAPGSIAEIRNAGFNIYGAKKGAGSVMDGISWILGKELCFTSRSKNLMKEANTYSRKRDKDGTIMDAVDKSMDDGMDAMRYGTEFYKSVVNNLEIGFI